MPVKHKISEVWNGPPCDCSWCNSMRNIVAEPTIDIDALDPIKQASKSYDNPPLGGTDDTRADDGGENGMRSYGDQIGE